VNIRPPYSENQSRFAALCAAEMCGFCPDGIGIDLIDGEFITLIIASIKVCAKEKENESAQPSPITSTQIS